MATARKPYVNTLQAGQASSKVSIRAIAHGEAPPRLQRKSGFRHTGRVVAIGETVEVDADLAAMLVGQGKAEFVKKKIA
jgi:hypothetical protein